MEEAPVAETAAAAEPAPLPFEPEQPETDAPLAAAPQSPPAAHGHDDEESIENYMARLMQRVGGSSEAASKPSAASSLRASMGLEAKAEQPAEPAPAPQPEETRVMDASEFIPRAKAPEKTSGLEAMRELANQSARSAIENSNKRKGGQEWLFRVFYAAVSGLAGLGIASWFGWFSLIGAVSAAVGLILAGLWSFQAVFLYQQAAAQAAEIAASPPIGKNEPTPLADDPAVQSEQ
jgi:hypothetical protein